MRTIIIVVVVTIWYICIYDVRIRRKYIKLCAFPREIYHLIFFTILSLPPRVVNNALAHYMRALRFSRAKRFTIAPIVYQWFFF